ncbi:GPP34 family phosphoprotein [Streptomyces sp. NPDC002793]|uniref:GPP34 family phosphoprotein n=1 Tax=Streptomyces sp. NPDC002793 TaxID=3154432 RepID=UPI00332B2CE4
MAGLVALIHAAELHRLAFPEVPVREVKPRMKKIAEGRWAGDDVRAAIRTMQAAMVAVTTVTVITAVS